MELKIKKQNIVLPMVLAVLLLLLLAAGGFYFSGYLKTQITRERTSQLEEITSQVRLILSNAPDVKWQNLTTAVNALETNKNFTSGEDMTRCIGELERICEMGKSGARLLLVDSRGICYGADQIYGVWPELKSLSWEEQQYTFVYGGRYWTFVRKLDAPIRTQADGISFTHAVLLQDVQIMEQQYKNNAYADHNEIYVLNSDGTKMYDYDQDKLLQAYNILGELEAMDEQSCTDIRAALVEDDGTVVGRFLHDGEEYYYCVTSLDEQGTLLLFLIPAGYVAFETMGMVDTMIRLLLLLAAILLLLTVFTVFAVLRQRGSAQIIHREQANLRRQEELYANLEDSNARLKESYFELSSAKAAVEQAFQIAEEANQAKNTFLFNISHDIRTPLNAIIGFLTLMRNEADNPEAVLDYSERIDAASQNLLELINDVLDMSKMESGKVTLSDSEINLAELIDEINAVIRPQAREKNQTFDICAASLSYEYLIGDKSRINQVLINLLSNAVKYTPENGFIQLRMEELPQRNASYSRIRFTVRDSGNGMSEEYLRVIFEPFTREHTSTTSGIQGSGLGMAITKNLVDLMGGTIHVASQPGKGSTFTVDLELRIQERDGQTLEDNFWSSHKLARMLVADGDEEVCRGMARTIMPVTGAAVDYVTNGEHALRMIRRAQDAGRPYDLILLDWKMPGMAGSETVRLIRKVCSDKEPVLLLTVYDWSEIEEEASEIGIRHFMPKPFFMSTFQETVRRLLESQEKPERQDADVVRNKHILVVDDITVNQMILAKTLTMLGASCDTAGNGQEAVEKFKASKPGEYDLILMDVQMPVMDGYAAARAIRSSEHPSAQTVPVIAVTANAFVDDVRDAIESGMDAHIAKPVQIEKLKATIQQVLDSRREQSGAG